MGSAGGDSTSTGAKKSEHFPGSSKSYQMYFYHMLISLMFTVSKFSDVHIYQR